jgi:hypothetical protein
MWEDVHELQEPDRSADEAALGRWSDGGKLRQVTELVLLSRAGRGRARLELSRCGYRLHEIILPGKAKGAPTYGGRHFQGDDYTRYYPTCRRSSVERAFGGSSSLDSPVQQLAKGWLAWVSFCNGARPR